MQETATASWGVPRERAELQVQLELGSKCFYSTDILCLPVLARLSAQCPVLSLWLSLSSWKNSLIKVQTVAIFPLLKWLKSFLCYVANSTMSLRQVHNTQSFLPPCCLPSPYEQNSTKRHSWQNRASSPHCHSLCYFLSLSLVPGDWATHLDRDCFSPCSAHSLDNSPFKKPNGEHTHVGTLPIFTYQNYLPRSQAQNIHVSVPLKPEKPWNAVLREPWAQPGPLTWDRGTRRLELDPGCSGVNN